MSNSVRTSVIPLMKEEFGQRREKEITSKYPMIAVEIAILVLKQEVEQKREAEISPLYHRIEMNGRLLREGQLDMWGSVVTRVSASRSRGSAVVSRGSAAEPHTVEFHSGSALSRGNSSRSPGVSRGSAAESRGSPVASRGSAAESRGSSVVSHDSSVVSRGSAAESRVSPAVSRVSPAVSRGSAAESQWKPSRSFGSACPVLGCGQVTRKLNRHCSHTHLPFAFLDDRAGPDASRQRLNGLNQLGSMLGLTDLWGLSDLVNANQGAVPYSAVVDERQACRMSELCELAGWPMPNRFEIHPVNSRASLIHWRVLVALVGQLSVEQQETFIKLCNTASVVCDQSPMRRVPDGGEEASTSVILVDSSREVCVGVKENTPVVGTSNEWTVTPEKSSRAECELPSAIDSHFHLDRTRRWLWGDLSRASTDDLLTNSGEPPPRYPVNLIGAVEVYCDPEWYPRELSTNNRWKVAVGAHPKKVSRLTDSRMSPDVSALGEVGLDHLKIHQSEWAGQEDMLRKVLGLCTVRKPLVLHIRGQQAGDTDVYTRCLNIVEECCAPVQPMHLHCFDGYPSVVHSWTRIFRYCYFGFTGSARKFDSDQVQGLRQVPEDRLLVETDSPYLPPWDGIRVNTPAYVGDVGEIVARLLGIPTERFLTITKNNARDLYNF